jgi:hypothetical protein
MTCPLCGYGRFPCTCSVDNDNQPGDPSFIRCPSAESLAKPSSVNRLAIAYRVMGLSRYKMLDFMSDQYMAYQGIVVSHERRRIDPLDIDVDHVFRTDDDPSLRWLSRFLHFGLTPPVQQAQLQTRARLMCLWLALAIKHPGQAELVIR